MRLIDADAFKEYCKTGMDETKTMIRSGSMRAFAEELTSSFIRDIDEQQTVPQWIPVWEKLPEEQVKVLVTDFDDVEMAYLNAEGRLMDFHGDKLKGVTAWMPLPEPYQQKGGEE